MEQLLLKNLLEVLKNHEYLLEEMDFKNPTLNGKTIEHEKTDDIVDIAGVNITSNICCRRMAYTKNDLA